MVKRFLAVVLIVLGLIGLAQGPASADTTDGDERAFVDLINQARADAGLAPLATLGSLRDVGRAHSTRMATTVILHHNPNLAADVSAVAPDWQRIGENVGKGGEVGPLHQAFMNSPGHRANVLGDYNYVGIGIVRGNGFTWVTEVFLKAPAGRAALSRVPTTRIAGASDPETSLAVSRRFPSGQSAAVVVGRIDVFADALAGSPLAAVHNGPVLLTGSSGVAAAVVDEARRVLRPDGIVFLLGGADALTPAVETAFTRAGLAVERLAGTDRYETAALIARRVNPTPATVLVASGVAFADAMVAGPAAGLQRAPIVLTSPGTVPAATADYLAGTDEQYRMIVGGPAAVSETVAVAVAATERVAGADRYETAVRVAQRWFGAAPQISVATGLSFQDALAGSPFSARAGIPVVLTSPTPDPATVAYVRSRLGQLQGSVVYGTSVAVPESAVHTLFG